MKEERRHKKSMIPLRKKREKMDEKEIDLLALTTKK